MGREYVGVEVFRDAGGLGGLSESGTLVRDHVGESAVYCEGWVVVFVAMLSLSKVVDWRVLVFE